MIETLRYSKMMLACLLLFILTAINTGTVGAANTLQLTSPSDVSVDEEFETSINYLQNDTYDVKIFVESKIDNKTVSEILSSGKWVSPFNYLVGAYPVNNIFKIRVKTYSDSAEICVRLRKTGSKTFKETCNNIKVRQSVDSNNNQDGTQNSTQNSVQDSSINSSEQDSKESKEQQESSVKKNDSVVYDSLSNSIQKDESPKKIILGSSTGSSLDKAVFVTKEEKIRRGIVYSFAALCVLLIILLSFNKL